MDITRLAKIFKQRDRFKKSQKEYEVLGLPKAQKTSIVTQKEENTIEETKLSLISSSLLQRREEVFNTFVEYCEEEINNLKKEETNEKLKTEEIVYSKFII